MPGNMACNILGAINQDLTTLQVEFIVNVGWMLPHVRYFTWGRIYIKSRILALAKTGENVISDSIFPATRQEIETAKWPLKGKGRLAILLFPFLLQVCHLFWLQLVDFFWDLGLK